MQTDRTERPGGKKKSLPASDQNDPRTQAEKFAQAARDLGADQDEDSFKGVLRKLAKPKVP